VILPMTVLRRLDSLLEQTKPAALEMEATLDRAGIVHQDQALRQASGHAFYNTSRFTMRDLRSRASQQQLKADFEAYLDGYSSNVQDILEKFEFRNQIPRLSKADALGTLIEKLVSPDVNLSPNPVYNGDGMVRHAGLDNHAMGTIFEELVRRFNEENNEEAGEHWTHGGPWQPDPTDMLRGLLYCVCGVRIKSDGTMGTPPRRRKAHPRSRSYPEWGTQKGYSAGTYERVVASQISAIRFDAATKAKIMRALTSTPPTTSGCGGS
jgi:HsdM N-terminal domain